MQPSPDEPTPATRGVVVRGLLAFAHLIKDAGLRWSDDNCLRLGASLAYYAVFSIFPLLLLATTVFGFFLGDSDETRARLLDALARTTTPAFRELFDGTLRDMQQHQTARGVGTIVGIVTLVFGASAVFSELQATLNQIWRVPKKESTGILHALLLIVRGKALSFLVVIGAAVAILASVAATATISALGQRALGAAPGVVRPDLLWSAIEAVSSIGVITFILGAMFRLIPDTRVEWRDVAWGALLTAVLFTAIKHMLAWYLTHLGSYAAYGAIGGFLCLLTWIYLASLFLFYGAEFSRVYAERYGSLRAAPRDDGPPSQPGQPLESSVTSSGTAVNRSATRP